MSPTTADAPPPQELIVVVPADASWLADVRDHLGSWLASVGASAELSDRLVLAVNEAVTNSIVHAYREGHRGMVRLTAKCGPESITIRVTDDGQWQPARPLSGNNGRGVLIMQESVEQVAIDRSPSGTTVTLVAELRSLDLLPEQHASVPEQHWIDLDTVGSTTVARLRGVVADRTASVQLRRALLAATCGGVVSLMVDTAEVDFITSELLDALFEVAKAVVGTGESMVVAAPSEQMRAALQPLGSVDTVDVVLAPNQSS